MRRGLRSSPQQFQPALVDPPVLPPRLGQEELQPLHGRVLGSDHRLRTDQTRQSLVPISRGEQAREILAKPVVLENTIPLWPGVLRDASCAGWLA
jgi:hypothetical protein